MLPFDPWGHSEHPWAMAVIAATFQIFLVIALAVGVALPKMTAALAEISPNVWVVVICNGVGMETITLGADGDPIPEPDLLAEHCVTADPSPQVALDMQAIGQLMRDHAHSFSVRERSSRRDLTAHPPVPRGPPIWA